MHRKRIKEINIVFFMTIIFALFGQELNSIIFIYTDNYLLTLLSSQLILILPSIVYIIKYKLNIKEAIRFKKIKAVNIILLIVFSYLITPLMSFVNALSMLFFQNTTSSFMEGIIEENGFFLSILIIALVPAIFEEVVYRGIFYNEYRKAKPLQAIFLSAFLFGIIHGNLNQFVYAFLMGIVFALIIEVTDSILSTMIIHFFINGTSVTALHLYSKSMNVEEEASQLEASLDQILTFTEIMKTLLWPAIICTILAAFVYVAIAKNEGRWEWIKEIFIKRKNQNEEKLISISLVIAIVICIVIMIINEIYLQ